jgi:hypothetical protein
MRPALALAVAVAALAVAAAACGSEGGGERPATRGSAAGGSSAGSGAAAGSGSAAGGAAPPEAAPATAASFPAACGAYREAIERLARCGDTLDDATRGRLRAMFERQWAAWEKLPEPDRRALAAICESSAETVREAAAAACGW